MPSKSHYWKNPEKHRAKSRDNYRRHRRHFTRYPKVQSALRRT
nr:hypothetical protein [Candidatus Njordarchaeota archaeon]